VQGPGRPGWRGITRPAQADFDNYGCAENRIRAEGRGDHPGRRGLPRFTLARARGVEPPSNPPGVSVSGSRAKGKDQDMQSREAGKPCILIAAVYPSGGE
jgi:hypothetical protein